MILVTGAGGLIGSWTLKVLYDHGIPVMGWYRTAPVKGMPWKVLTGDLATIGAEAFADLVKACDTIVHCAAYLPAKNDELEKALVVNKKIDENAVKCAVSGNKRLIYLSGTSVYGFSNDMADEETATELKGIARKYEVENLIKEKVEKYVILRVSAPYGPGQQSRTVLRIFIENALAQKPLLYYGSGEREQDFTFAGDIALAVLKCIEQPGVIGIFNITSGKAVNMKNLARVVVDQVPGSRSEVKAAGIPDEQEKCKARYSIRKAKEVLGWQPGTSIEEGIKKWAIHLKNESRSI